jgi:hypothetical protein
MWLVASQKTGADSFQRFVKEAVELGSLLRTDGFLSYDRLEKRGYRQRITVPKGRKELAGRAAAPRPSGRVAPETVALEHAPGGGLAGPFGLLQLTWRCSVPRASIAPTPPPRS